MNRRDKGGVERRGLRGHSSAPKNNQIRNFNEMCELKLAFLFLISAFSASACTEQLQLLDAPVLESEVACELISDRLNQAKQFIQEQSTTDDSPLQLDKHPEVSSIIETDGYLYVAPTYYQLQKGKDLFVAYRKVGVTKSILYSRSLAGTLNQNLKTKLSTDLPLKSIKRNVAALICANTKSPEARWVLGLSFDDDELVHIEMSLIPSALD